MLGQQVMRLEGPIASLQPGMLGLHDSMGDVKKQMMTMETQMTQILAEMKGSTW